MENWSIRKKNLTTTILLPCLLVTLFLSSYAVSSRNEAVAANVDAVRNVMGSHWEIVVIAVEQLRGYQEEGDIGSLFAAVPIVNAWRTATKKAEDRRDTRIS